MIPLKVLFSRHHEERSDVVIQEKVKSRAKLELLFSWIATPVMTQAMRLVIYTGSQ